MPVSENEPTQETRPKKGEPIEIPIRIVNHKKDQRTFANKRAAVQHALTQIEKDVSPVVRKSTEELVEQYQETLRKLARQ